MSRFSRFAAAGVFSVMIAVPAAAQTTIDTWAGWQEGVTGKTAPMPSPNGGAFNTYMQIVTAPTGDNVLTSWTSFLHSTAVPLQFRVAIFQWDADAGTAGAAVLPALLLSSVFTSPLAATPQAVNVFTGSLALTSGMQYAFMIGGINLPQAPGADARIAYRTDQVYAGGHGARMNATNVSGLFAANPAWQQAGDVNAWQHYAGNDLALQLTFEAPMQQVVPEPMTMILFGTGLAGVAAARRRRKGALPNA